MNKIELEKQYNSIYTKKILPRAQTLETERKDLFQKAVIISAIIVVLDLIVYFLYLMNIENGFWAAIIGGVAIISILWTGINSTFINKFKKDFQNHILSIFGKFNVSDTEMIPLGELELLYPYAERKRTDDKIVGSYKDVAVVIEEAECYKEEIRYRNGKQERHKTTYFDGVLIKLSMNKTNKAVTVLKRKELIDTAPRGLQKVMLEDPEFQKIYASFSDDQIEARYILTTAFMERLKNISLAFSNANPDVICRGEYILLAVPTSKNLFEVGNVFKTLLDQTIYRDMFNQMVAILQMIDQLKLDQKTGL